MNNSPAREHYLSLLEKYGSADRRRTVDRMARLVAQHILGGYAGCYPGCDLGPDHQIAVAIGPTVRARVGLTALPTGHVR